MKQCFLLIVTVFLVASILPAAGCTDTTDTGPYSRDDVDFAFTSAASEKTLPDRQEFYRWWSVEIIWGSIKYLEYSDVYEIEFPGREPYSTEVWGIDMKNSQIVPLNSGALLTAILLFCQDRDDPNAECQLWFSLLDAMAEGMD